MGRIMESVFKIPATQIVGLIAAIAGVGMYAARIDSQVSENQTRTIEIKADVDKIQADVRKHGEVLATLKADGRYIIRTLEKLQAKRRRR